MRERETFKTLLALENTLGKHLAVAHCLGYSERQYYNIRQRAKKGLPPSPRLEAVLKLTVAEIGLNQPKESQT